MKQIFRTALFIVGFALPGCTPPPQPVTSTAKFADIPPATAPSSDPALRYRMNDCHLHLVDFLQRTDGIAAALAAMDKAGIDEAVVSGMPVVKEWPQDERARPEYYLDDDSRCYWYSATDVLVARQVMSLPADQQRRFHPIICGFNGADRNAVDHVRRMVDWYPGFWQGIGEVMTRHDDLTALTYGDPARADGPALSRVFAFAGEHDLPIFLHSNAGSVWKREPIYLPEVESAVSAHPQTRFVWCHAGISRRIEIPTLTEELDRLLNTYPNLWIDVSWVVFETNLLTKDGKPNPKWIKLIESHPTRFLIGSDKVGHFSDYGKELLKYYPFLDELKPQTARNLAHDNLAQVLPKRGASLSQQESDIFNGRQSPQTELLKSK